MVGLIDLAYTLPSLGTRRSFGNLPGNRQIAVNPLTEARSFRRSILLLFQQLG